MKADAAKDKPPLYVSRQVYKILESDGDMDEMNQRLRLVRTHFYSCQDQMNPEAFYRVMACAEFFCTQPKNLGKDLANLMFFDVYEMSKRNGKMISTVIFDKTQNVKDNITNAKSQGDVED